MSWGWVGDGDGFGEGDGLGKGHGFRKGREGRAREEKGREGREGKRKTKSGYDYVSAHRQTHGQTHKSENSIFASFTPFTWRI